MTRESKWPAFASSVLAESRQAYVAIESERGPHVTPELYGWSADRLWFASASSTLKSRVLADDPRAGVLVSGPAQTVVLGGDVEMFDVADLATLAKKPELLLDAGRAVAGYTARNMPDLAAFVRDTVSGRLGAHLPERRVLFALTPTRAAFIENEALVGTWGSWDRPTDGATGVAGGGRQVVAALSGPNAAPARWFAEERRLYVTPELLDTLDPGHDFNVAIVMDEYNAPGPDAKEGELLRGGARRSTEPGWLDVELSRSTEWDGVETKTRKIS